MRDGLRSLLFVVRSAFRADRWRAAAVFALVPLTGVATAAFGLWLKLLADAAGAGRMGLALLGAAALAATVVARHLLAVVLGKLRFMLQERTGLLLEARLVELSASLPGLEHHERPEYLDKLEHLRTERGSLGQAVGVVVVNLSVAAEAVAMVVLLATVHPALLVLPLFGLPSLLASRRGAVVVDRAKEETAQPRRVGLELLSLTASLGPAKEIRLFGLGDHLLARHRNIAESVRDRQVRSRVVAAAWEAGSALIFVAGFVGAIALVMRQAGRGEATAGDVLLTLRLATQVNGSLTGVADMTGWLHEVLLVAGHYLWLEDGARAAAQSRRHVPPPPVLRRGIVVEDVWFRYPGTEAWVLQGVSLHLPPGSVVALVGDNGAGKTSLVKLLCGFYRPTGGRITVEGIDLADLDAERWRRCTSGVFQDFCKLELLAREAVGVGDLGRMQDVFAVRRAVNQADAGNLVARLPDGIESQLGRTFGGSDLSEGQWQRLAVARGRMREQPLLLVLDEPTSALDAGTEHGLVERLRQHAHEAGGRGAVTVIVSHRLSTVRNADLVVMLDQGRVVQVGPHDQLMRGAGLYPELYALQAQGYR